MAHEEAEGVLTHFFDALTCEARRLPQSNAFQCRAALRAGMILQFIRPDDGNFFANVVSWYRVSSIGAPSADLFEMRAFTKLLVAQWTFAAHSCSLLG